MDEHKLKSRFRSQSSPTASDVPTENHLCTEKAKDKDLVIQQDEEETNIDDEPASVKRIATLKQKVTSSTEFYHTDFLIIIIF